MRKRINGILLALILLFITFTIIACSSDPYSEAEKYESSSIEMVEIVQLTKTDFKVDVTLPSGTYSSADVYFSRFDKLKATDEKLESQITGNKISFNLTATSGDYFLFINTSTGDFTMSVTIPKMNPFVSLRLIGEDIYAAIDYSIDGKTSWSSFIDPTGKSVYKSTQKTFDESATAVKLNIPITESLTNDLNYSSEKPYYFIVFNGKNGKLRFTTFPLVTAEYVFDSMSADIELNLQGIPTLKVGFVPFNIEDSFRLLVRSGDEKHYVETTNNNFTFLLTRLTKENVWYDIVLEDTKTAQQYNLQKDNAVNFNRSLNYASRVYGFKEYNNDLKVYFEIQ